MILGFLLACSVSTDVSSCRIIYYNQEEFYTKLACENKMKDLARYTADRLRVLTRPYCFSVNLPI
jgi:hypothetical protein